MKKIFFAGLSMAIFMAACTTPFKKTKDGSTEYKIIAEKGGKLLATGNIMEMNVTVKYKDSLLFSSSETGMPQFAMYDTAQFPPTYKEIFRTLHVGDSIVIKTSVDTIMKQGMAEPFMKKGEFVYQSYKVTNAYATQAEADKARDEAMKKAQVIMDRKEKEQLVKDDKTISDYLKKNNITATKAPMGTYVQIIEPGAGPNIDTTVVARVNYTGKTMAGKMFDSNTDPSKGHVEPYDVNMTNDPSLGGVIKGWSDALPLLKKGSKAKIYIPSSLAYGKQGAGQDIGPDEILVFDIDVLDFITVAQAKQNMEAKRKQMEAMQKAYMDSVRKANPNAGMDNGGQQMPQGN